MTRCTPMLTLASGHACVDIYQGSVAALVPFFVAERDYTYAAASGLVLAASVLSSLVQPLFGVLTDRWAMPWLLPISTILGGLGIALSGLSRSYALTLAFVALSGVGVAAYHPESARVARIASRGSHTAMGWFSLGGNIGFAAAPLMVGSVMAAGGLRLSPMLIIPALAGSVLGLPVLRAIARDHADSPHSTSRTGPDDLRSFVRLAVAVVFRSIAFVGLSTFIAFYVAERTGSGTTAGSVGLFVLYVGGAVGTVLGGRLAGRWGRVRVARWAYLLAGAAIAGVVLVPGAFIYGFVALAAIGLYVPFSVQVTLGQDYLPNRVGTASGLTLGLTVSVGGLASPVIGRLADISTLQVALAPLIVMPLLSWLLFRHLAEPSVPLALRVHADRF